MSKARTLADLLDANGDVKVGALGNAPDPLTKSAGDPTVNTGGSVGDVFVNTLSGAVFVLTDATAGANVWRNAGDQSGPVGGNPYSIEVLLVGGGGGGTRGTGSGGSGAGGYLEGSMTVTSAIGYPVVVGAGGAAATADNSIGSKGSDSVFNNAVAVAGGVGSRNGEIGLSGGSGGGAGGASINGTNRANTAATQTDSGGLTGYGNTGGSSTGYGWYIGSGGGGAGAVGENCPGDTNVRGGTGGAGRQWVDGNYYAGGGGGGSESTAAIASAAVGGGGASGRNGTAPTAGQANTGGGAGGTGLANQTAAAGGSGVVIIRYAGSQKGFGGTVTSSGGYTYHTFTSSGTYTA